MSLSVAGVWAVDVWDQTVWADGVWREGSGVEELVGGVKAKVVFKDVDPVWKQKERKEDWVDEVIEKQAYKQHKPDIIDIELTVDEQIREIYTQQRVRRKKRNRNKALALLLKSL